MSLDFIWQKETTGKWGGFVNGRSVRGFYFWFQLRMKSGAGRSSRWFLFLPHITKQKSVLFTDWHIAAATLLLLFWFWFVPTNHSSASASIRYCCCCSTSCSRLGIKRKAIALFIYEVIRQCRSFKERILQLVLVFL